MAARSPTSRRRRVRKPVQLAFTYATHGGARRGAGRPPKGARAGTPHRARLKHRRDEPVHVTLRSRLRGLRSQRVFARIRAALALSSRGGGAHGKMGVVDFSVQGDHVHLIVEASDTQALSRGMRGLVIRLARAINKALGRKGPVWGDRWHGVALTSPRQVRHALADVLMNHGKHTASQGLVDAPWLDPCSSGPWFDGWRAGLGPSGRSPPASPSPSLLRDLPTVAPPELPTVAPSTWLRRVGWRRHGLLTPCDGPRPGGHSPV